MDMTISMPALSPTMEEGALARWLIKPGDAVRAGDIIAEIETDKATMELEAAEDGLISELVVPAGSEAVKVGEVIARLADPAMATANSAQSLAPSPEAPPVFAPSPAPRREALNGGRSASETASPLARHVAALRAIDLDTVAGTGPDRRILMRDVAPAKPPALRPPTELADERALPITTSSAAIPAAPHTIAKLSSTRKTIARRLTASKQQIPHIYLTVDVRLDALLALRGELNAGLASRGVKLSVNDMMIKALGRALMLAPACNVMFAPEGLVSFTRADISVAVSTPAGLITPIIAGAELEPLSSISSRMVDLAHRARENRLHPHEYQGGTASLSNLGMYGIKQFEAIINPPQGMILAVGASERRLRIGDDDAVAAETVLCATGSFDHRAIDGADAAHLMQSFKALIEEPWSLLA
jgi:pyruvate dehydrogenase E2 component (dihydrolipoamide acetyltransferase)